MCACVSVCGGVATLSCCIYGRVHCVFVCVRVRVSVCVVMKTMLAMTLLLLVTTGLAETGSEEGRRKRKVLTRKCVCLSLCINVCVSLCTYVCVCGGGS